MRLAVLGLGFMGSTHVKALRTIPHATLAAVYSNDPVKLEGDLSAIQGNIGGKGEHMDFTEVRKYRQIDKLLADDSIEAVDICLPTDLHASVALDALRAGKHVLVEKPIALHGEAADQLVREAQKLGRILMAAQVLRFFPVYQVLRATLESGRLGPVRAAAFRRRCAAPVWSAWLGDANKSGGGVFDLLIHDVDMALHLFGMPEAVTATGFEDLPRGIDILEAHLLYPDRLTVTISGGWHHPKAFPFSMGYTVVSEGGTVEYSSAGVNPTVYTADGREELLPMTDADGYAAEIAYFVDCCRRQVPPSLCPPEDSAKAVKLMNFLRQARERNGAKLLCKL